MNTFKEHHRIYFFYKNTVVGYTWHFYLNKQTNRIFEKSSASIGVHKTRCSNSHLFVQNRRIVFEKDMELNLCSNLCL